MDLEQRVEREGILLRRTIADRARNRRLRRAGRRGRPVRRRFGLRRLGLRPEDCAARLGLGRELEGTAPATSAEARGDERQRKGRQRATGEERQSRRHGDSSQRNAGAL